MGTTPNFGIPYPEGSDPPDGAAQMNALATAVDTALESINTRGAQGFDNGNSSPVTIPDGNAWGPSGDPVVNIAVPSAGELFIWCVVNMEDPGDTGGGPQARITVTGPVGEVGTNIAEVNVSSGTAVTATVPINASVPVTAAGTVAIQREVRHTIASGTNGTYWSFDVMWLYAADRST